jgi:hypothetical protein
LILLFNVEGLNTHIADIDMLLNDYKLHICILTSLGAAGKKFPEFIGYSRIFQIGTKSYEEVVILYQKDLKCSTVEKDFNFLLIEIQIPHESLLVGAVYVPPRSATTFSTI